jgi:hypothetical protein
MITTPNAVSGRKSESSFDLNELWKKPAESSSWDKDDGGKHARNEDDYKHDRGHDWKDDGGKHARKDDHDKYDKGHDWKDKDDDYKHGKENDWKDDGGKHARKDEDCRPDDSQNDDGCKKDDNCEPECKPAKEIVCKDPCDTPEPCQDPCETLAQLNDPSCDMDQCDLHSALASMSDVSSVVEFAIDQLSSPDAPIETAGFAGLEGADTFHDTLAG